VEAQRWVALARILRPRGNKGEVAAEILTDFPERLTGLREVFLGNNQGKTEPKAIGVESCWLSQNHRGQAVFHFAGYSSISEAEKLRGLEVLVPFEQRVALPEGQYFFSDLIGCEVFEAPTGEGAAAALLGVVQDVEVPGEGALGTPLLVVETARGELLVPLAEDICTVIDTAARRIEVVLPEGLRDLNAS
jgi:16S rRNA processing protein RimM